MTFSLRSLASLFAVALLAFATLGCGASTGTSEVQPGETQTQAEIDAYEAEMNKPSDMGG